MASFPRWLRGRLRAGAAIRDVRPPVMKCGGSLLGMADWPSRLVGLLHDTAGSVLIVAGGGPVVDGLRVVDAAGGLDAATSHQLAIDALGLTARAVSAALGLPLTATADQAGPAVLDTPDWLCRHGQLVRLPVGWHVTSDSIAASVAVALDRPLLLVKRVPPPEPDLDALATRGWIDPHFPEASARLEVIDWAAPAS